MSEHTPHFVYNDDSIFLTGGQLKIPVREVVDRYNKLADNHDRLTRENRILQMKADASLANNLCPDHRDKQASKPCLACTIEKLQSKNNSLASEVERLEGVLHSIYRRAELAEADGVHMRGALGNIKDAAAKAFSSEKPEIPEWEPFEGDYEKHHYDALLPDGTIVPYCWPNAGYLNASDGSGDMWGGGECQYRASRLHPLDDVRGPTINIYKRYKP